MPTEVGEYLVGAYLKLVEHCDVVDYNVLEPGGGLRGLNELDVVGFHFATSTVYLCEATTHVTGLLYQNNVATIDRIKRKHQNQRTYAKRFLGQFKNKKYMFWSPKVPKGYLTEHLAQIKGLDLIINGEYKRRVYEMLELAKDATQDTGNQVFRVFQILGALEKLKD